MPNGHGARQEDDEKQIARTTSEGWEPVGDPPGWVVKAAKKQGLDAEVGFGKYDTFHGDTFVYRVDPTVHGRGIHVYRKLKSDHFETNRNEGTCPNCQAYVRRLEEDRFLTCHRCGWKVGYPVLRWLRYASWISYYFR